MKKQTYDPTMLRAVDLVILALALFVVGCFYVVVEAQAERADYLRDCQGVSNYFQGHDWTSMLLEFYDADLDPVWKSQLIDIFYVPDLKGGTKVYIEGEGDDAVWYVVNRIEGGKASIWAGTDTTVGEDGQMHQSSCYLIVDDSQLDYFDNLQECTYKYPYCDE